MTGALWVAEGFVLVAAFAFVAIGVDYLIDRRGREGSVVVVLVLSHAPAGAVRVKDPLRFHVLRVDWPGLFADCAVNVSTKVVSQRCTVVAVLEVCWFGSGLDFCVASAHGEGIVSWWLDKGVRWPRHPADGTVSIRALISGQRVAIVTPG